MLSTPPQKKDSEFAVVSLWFLDEAHQPYAENVGYNDRDGCVTLQPEGAGVSPKRYLREGVIV